MRQLYPEIKPFNSFMLDVGPGHQLYIEQCGNAAGVPVVFLHGGPGAGCTERDRRYFDPSHYHIILFDQRGSGRSKPHATLEENHPKALVEDMEAIRKKLGIEQWVLFGGSWGSTLSLLYAIEHPKRVSSMILRGIFLCREKDIAWFYEGQAGRIFPDHWSNFEALIPPAERHNMVEAYYTRLTGDDELMRMHAAKEWSNWEGQCATLHTNVGLVDHFNDPHLALSLARIEAHYFKNKLFLPENVILNRAKQLANIPMTLIHGRYDVICPLDNATDLAKACPHARLDIIRDAGHASVEPGIVDALVKAADGYAKLLA